MGKLYIGVMSGTSLDGIDVALCEIDAQSCSLLHANAYEFPKELRQEILTLISGTTTLQQVGTLHSKLGHLFADAITKFLTQFNIEASSIEAIGLHGQTLWHQPKGEFPFSMQLGCANVVHVKTNIKVVSDFRNMDIANGGEGAPFAPAFHKEIFASLQEKVAVLNIGGMANITFLGEEVKGWDIGAGNVLLDLWIKQCKNLPFDKDGKFAQSGEVNDELLQKMLKDAYYKKLPPKSTGREYFNATWLGNKLPMFGTVKEKDIQRTLLELTVQSITKDVKNTDVTTLIVCGGGAKNTFLLQRLQELLECKVQTSDSFGVSSEYMEAMAFAWLGYKRLQGEAIDLCSVTGAKKNSILGALYG